MKTSVLFCCLFLVCIQGGLAAIFRDVIHTEEVFGRTAKYCEYKSVRLLPGPRSKLRDYDACVKCTCSNDGLECVSISPTITAIGECTVVKIRCRNYWVMKNDLTKRCPKRLRQAGAMVGK